MLLICCWLHFTLACKNAFFKYADFIVLLCKQSIYCIESNHPCTDMWQMQTQIGILLKFCFWKNLFQHLGGKTCIFIEVSYINIFCIRTRSRDLCKWYTYHTLIHLKYLWLDIFCSDWLSLWPHNVKYQTIALYYDETVTLDLPNARK